MIGNVLGSTIKDKNAIKRQIGTRDSKLSFFKPLPSEELNVKERYTIVKTRNTSSVFVWGRDSWGTAHWYMYDSFILGHSTNGKLGEQTGVCGYTIVLGDFNSSWAIQRIVQSENTYREWFYDDTFKDASTTATWDTTNHKIDFASGQVAKSTSVFYNNQTVVSVLVSASYTGTLKFEISADGGSNWEEVTLDEMHPLTNTGTDLRWRITETGSSSATLNSLIIKYNVG